MGGNFPVSKVGKQDAMAYHEKEKKEMLKILDEYVQLCAKTGVNPPNLTPLFVHSFLRPLYILFHELALSLVSRPCFRFCR